MEEQQDFQKKQVIFAGGIGVCRVENIVNLKERSGQTRQYYVLRSVYDQGRTAYIPVEGHKAELRELMPENEVRKKLNDIRVNDKKAPEDERETGEIAWVLGMKLGDLISELNGTET